MTEVVRLSPIAGPVLWYLVLLAYQGAAWPLVFRWAGSLPDRGYCAARVSGMLVSAWLCWTGWVYGFWRLGAVSAWFCLLSVGTVVWATSVASCRRSGAQDEEKGEAGALGPLAWMRRNSHLVLTVESIQLCSFVMLIGLRTFLPVAGHTEQPSDLMMMSSIGHSAVFPAQDGWLAGFPISYYAFGYWQQVFTGTLLGIPPTLAYNLGLATLFSLLCGGCFGVGYNLAAFGSSESFRPGWARTQFRRGMIGGLGTVGVICFAGNFRTVYDAVRYGLTRSDWWWLSSRAIRDLDLAGRVLPNITEFPAFSFILGDNHPHVQSAPLLVLLVLVLMSVFLSRRSVGTRSAEATRVSFSRSERLLLGFLVGALLATNSWDVPAAFVLISVTAWFLSVNLPSVPGGERVGLLPRLFLFGGEVTCVAAVALIGFGPHLLTADARVRGLLPNLWFPTPLRDFIAAAGPGWLGLGLLVPAAWPALRRRRNFRRWIPVVGVVPLGFGAAIFWVRLSERGGRWLSDLGAGNSGSILWEALRRWGQEPFVVAGLALCSILAFAALQSRLRASRAGTAENAAYRLRPPLAFAIALTLSGCILLLVPEFVFIHDAFTGRVNSVFKFHYEAWLLVGIAGAYGLSLRPESNRVRRLRAGALVLASLTLIYPLAAPFSRLSQSGWRFHDLDALESLRNTEPELYATLRWVTGHLPAKATVLECPGSREERGSSRVSVLTGRPTPLGWIDHEMQWRSGEAMQERIERRAKRIAEAYSAESSDVLERSLSELKVRYVLVGTRERERFGIGTESSLFDACCRRLFRSGAYQLFDCGTPRPSLEAGRP